MNPRKTAVKNVPLTQFCGDLRSKKFYMMDTIPSAAEDYLDPSGHCWCHHTQMALGPDGQHAGPDKCVPGRKCYRSALA
ncbi:MAG: hypothetical protein ACTHN5_14645 [Phycisphaerae bacterium]